MCRISNPHVPSCARQLKEFDLANSCDGNRSHLLIELLLPQLSTVAVGKGKLPGTRLFMLNYCLLVSLKGSNDQLLTTNPSHNFSSFCLRQKSTQQL